MFIKYDKYELIELFWEEPVVLEKDAEIYKYNKNDDFGFRFSMYMSTYDQVCSLSLYFKDYEKPIYDIGFKGVRQIEGNNNKLTISLNKGESDVVVFFKPNFTLVFEEH